MNDKNTSECSQCGKKDVPKIRYIACVSTTEWPTDNYPAPNSSFTTKDDIKIWKIVLCDECLPASYKIYLVNQKKGSTTKLIIGSILVAIGTLVIIINPSDGPGFMNNILMIASIIGLFIGIITVPSGIYGLVSNSNRIKALNKTGSIPEKYIDKAFIGEGERIIKNFEKSEAANTDTGLSLPGFKTLNDLTLTEKEKRKVIHKDGIGNRKRSIISVANSIQELEISLPSEWLVILNK